MKKRAMKKWIPKGIYCHGDGTKKNPNCKWRKYIKTVKLNKANCPSSSTCKEECWTKPNNSCQERVYRCEYLKYTDYHEDSLLWDACKECREHEQTKGRYLWELSHGFCKRNKKYHV